MKLKITTAIFALSSAIMAQTVPYWKLGGNPAPGPVDGVGAANNIFGTVGNFSVRSITNNQQRMEVFGTTTSPSTPNGGGLAIHLNPANPIPIPKSLLTIGEDADPIGVANSGWRPWMQVGVFNTTGSDQAYFGLKNEGVVDRNDAVLVWGDDVQSAGSPNQYGPDYFRIIFSADFGNGTNSPTPQGNDGLEIVRMSPFGRMGIGNYNNSTLFTATKEPARRLEILSDKTVANGNGNPILRLTHTQSTVAGINTTGIYSEFEPRSNGDLFISVRDNTQTNTATHILKERFTGINTNSAGNTLEINSQLINSSTINGNAGAPSGNATGWAGLRFTDLTSKCVPQKNPGPGVLAVDSLGDVIYVPGNTGTGLGNSCGATQNPLTSNWEIPMAGFNLNFTMPANSSSQINIGAPTCITVPARMGVYNDNFANGFGVISQLSSANSVTSISGTTQNSGSGNSIGVNGNATGSTLHNIGINGISSDMGTATNLAINGNAANGNLAIAGNLDVIGSSAPVNIGHQTDINGGTNANATNYGVQVFLNNQGQVNFGGYFGATLGTTNYGIYALAPSGSGQTPGGTPNGPNYAGYFNGDVVRTGTDNFTSDQNLKQNIDTIANAMGIIMQLKPKTYEYKQSSYPSMNLPGGKQYGLIAQEVQTVLPELVNTNIHPAKLDSVGNVTIPAFTYLSLEYQQLIGVMLRGMQQQQDKIDSLIHINSKQDSINNTVQKQLAELSSLINTCCSNNAKAMSNNNAVLNQLDIELSDKDAIVLNQNVPNPFAEQTTITYNVPESVAKAQIIFYNGAGQIIQTIDITTRGKGKVNVFASDLSSGLYNYSLIADGKVVDSKKMVRE